MNIIVEVNNDKVKEVYIEKIEVYETSDAGNITKLSVCNGNFRIVGCHNYKGAGLRKFN